MCVCKINNKESSSRTGRGNKISDLSFHEGLFKGKGVVVMHHRTSLSSASTRHQQNSSTVESLVNFSRFLEGGGRREPGRQAHMHQCQDAGPRRDVFGVWRSKRHGAEVKTHTCTTQKHTLKMLQTYDSLQSVSISYQHE